jgi:hypothetical protein
MGSGLSLRKPPSAGDRGQTLIVQLHPSIAPLSFLLGTWRGEGTGSYPTIDDFAYIEEVTFAHVGKPFVAYTQRTRDRATGEPRHAEAGYLRPVGANGVELVLAQPSGIVEVHTGTVDGQRIELVAQLVATTPTAKSVTAVRRQLSVVDDRLSYVVEMAAVGQPLQFHLRAELVKAAEGA